MQKPLIGYIILINNHCPYKKLSMDTISHQKLQKMEITPKPSNLFHPST